MRRAFAAIALAGCDLVFPAQEVPDPIAVHATLREDRVTNEPSHRPRTTSAPASVTAQVRIGGNRPVDVDVVDGAVSFDRGTATTPYRLIVTRGALDTEVQSSAATLTVAFGLAGRDGVAPTKPTKIAVPADPPGEQAALYSTGQWSLTFPVAGTSFDWRNALPASEVPVGLLSGAAGDELFYLRYETPTPTSTAAATTTLVAGTRDTSEMVDGGTVDLQATPAAMPADQCARVSAKRTTESARFAVAAPGVALAEDFQIAQFPAPQIGMFGGIFLYTASNAGMSTPIEGPVAYHRLEPDYPVVATAAVFGTRTLQHRDAQTPIDLAMDLRWFDEVPADCTTTLALTTDLCPPVQPSLGTKPLVGDETPVTLPTSDPELRWDCDGMADYYTVRLYEVRAVDGKTTIAPLRTVMTADTHALIDHTLFAADKVYAFSITSFRGYPGAHDGDFATRVAFPSAASTIYTGSFRTN